MAWKKMLVIASFHGYQYNTNQKTNQQMFIKEALIQSPAVEWRI